MNTQDRMKRKGQVSLRIIMKKVGLFFFKWELLHHAYERAWEVSCDAKFMRNTLEFGGATSTYLFQIG